MFRRILVAVDPTHAEEGGRAITTALAQLASGGEIRLITIISGEGTAFFPYVPDQPIEETESQAHLSLETLAQEYLSDQAHHDLRVLHGVTEHTLADEAAAWEADLLVLTSHAGSGWALHRDTVQKICGDPPCAVLVLPAPE
jgi:nucleotide-binding universal stress UspA family protein